MTATEVYECDSTFRALIDVWEREFTCPVVLIDRIQELGLSASVLECVQWVIDTGNRPTLGIDCKAECNVYPAMRGNTARWFISIPTKYKNPHQNVLWYENVGEQDTDNIHFSDARSALLWLLDNWR